MIVQQHTSISLHLDKVERAVEPAVQIGGVDGEGELLVEELEHPVVVARLVEEEDAGSHVPAELSVGDKRHAELVVAVGGDAVGALPLLFAEVLDGAVGGARVHVGADGRVPQVAGVAVDVVVDLGVGRIS